MASIEKRSNGKYRVRFRDPAGRQRERNFARKFDAERFKISVEHSKLVGTYVDPKAGRLTFQQYAEQWRAIQVHRPSTRDQVESNLRNHVFPHFGGRALDSIRPTEIQAWVSARSKLLAPGTVELIYRYVVAVYRAAVSDRLIQASPCVGIKLPKSRRSPIIPLETDEVLALIAAMPSRYRALLMLAAGTGLRPGECFGLTVDRVDFLKSRTVTVDRQLILLPGQVPQFGPPKTEASFRTVPMPAIVQDALAAHLAEFGEGPDRLIFTNDDQGPIRRTRFSEVWRQCVKLAGVPDATRFHDMRHYYASLLIRHGESVKVVQSRLGHASATETLDTYAHLWPDSEDRTRGAVDAVLNQVGYSLAETEDVAP